MGCQPGTITSIQNWLDWKLPALDDTQDARTNHDHKKQDDQVPVDDDDDGDDNDDDTDDNKDKHSVSIRYADLLLRISELQGNIYMQSGPSFS